MVLGEPHSTRIAAPFPGQYRLKAMSRAGFQALALDDKHRLLL
jgi:hypothetical protein